MNRIYYTGGVLVVLVMWLTAVQEKKAAHWPEVQISVLPLPDGHSIVNDQDVQRVLTEKFGRELNDVSLTELDADRVEQALEEASFIKNAEVYVDKKGRLHAQIEQRQPVLRIIDSTNDNYYLDAEGVRFPVTRHYTARVPVATGAIPPYVADFQDRTGYPLRELFVLSTAIRQDKLLSRMCEQLVVETNNDLIMVPKVGSFHIVFGDANELPGKFRRLEIFLKQALPRVGWNRYSRISVKYRGQVVARRKSGVRQLSES